MMNRVSMMGRITAAAAGLAVCLAATSARAGISVSPLKQEITVKPGQTARLKISVGNTSRNLGDPPQSVHVEVMDVAVSDQGTLAFKEAGSLPNSASKWITLGAGALTLETGQTREVECKIAAPFTPGEFYSAVMVTIDSQDRKNEGLKIVHRIASGVFVTVSGRSPTKEAKITRCEVVWPALPGLATTQPDAVEPAKIAVLLKNTGHARFDAAGRISITDARSRTVFTAPLISARPCIFAGDSRLFEAALARPLPAGQYQIRVECDYQSSWGKANARMPMEITADQAELLKAIQKQPAATQPVQPAAHKLAAVMPPGAFRSLHLTLKNNGQEDALCEATLVAEGDRPVDASWVTMEPRKFTIAGAGSRTVEVAVRVAAGAAPGRYASTVLVEAGGSQGDRTLIRTPLVIDVKGEAK